MKESGKAHRADLHAGEIRVRQRQEQQGREDHVKAECFQPRPEALVKEWHPLERDPEQNEQEDRQDSFNNDEHGICPGEV